MSNTPAVKSVLPHWEFRVNQDSRLAILASIDHTSNSPHRSCLSHFFYAQRPLGAPSQCVRGSQNQGTAPCSDDFSHTLSVSASSLHSIVSPTTGKLYPVGAATLCATTTISAPGNVRGVMPSPKSC